MVWTPDNETPDDDRPGLCDSCLQPLTEADAGRFRHRGCVAPQLPSEARNAIARMQRPL